jgi:hypothetical protein
VHAFVGEELAVRLTADEPQQLFEHGAPKHAFRRQQRELSCNRIDKLMTDMDSVTTVSQTVATLHAKDGNRPRSCSIGTRCAFRQDTPNLLQILHFFFAEINMIVYKKRSRRN